MHARPPRRPLEGSLSSTGRSRWTADLGPRFGIDVVVLDGARWVLVAGEIDVAAAAELAAALRPGHARGALVADLRDVDFVDCAGLEPLLRARIRADADGAELRVLASGPVHRLADLLGLGDHLGLEAPAGSSRQALA